MRINLFAWFLVIIGLFGVSPAIAADFDVSLGTGYLAGDSIYQIGGLTIDTSNVPVEYHFPISQLKFPLDSFMVKGEIAVDFAEKWRFSGNAQTNVTEDTGKLEDSDWLVSPSSLDIYSESDAEMSALLLDAKLEYRFYQGYYREFSFSRSRTSNLLFSYFVGLGYKQQHFEFDVKNVDQWYPSTPSLPHDYSPGLAVTYQVDYQIPYLQLSMDMNAADRFDLILSLTYAPVINVKDEDHHLLRDKVNIADHDWNGSAKALALQGRYKFTKHWYLALEAEAMQIESKGRSNAYFNGVWDHSISQKIKSHQYSSFLRVGYHF